MNTCPVARYFASADHKIWNRPPLPVWLIAAAPLATRSRGEAWNCRRRIASILGGSPLVASVSLSPVIVIAAAALATLPRPFLIVARDVT